MRRPRWIATLVLALAVAAGFAALGQWQLGRAVSTGTAVNDQTENVRPLADVAKPQTPVVETQAAQRVSVAGEYVPSGYGLLGDRLNDGEPGYWVIGQLHVDGLIDTSLAVALGWTSSADDAQAAVDALAAGGSAGVVQLEGRYLPTEAPAPDDAEKPVAGPSSFGTGVLETTMAVSSLINSWPDFDANADVYGGYLVVDEAPAGLTAIDSPEPDRSVQLNWLNIFYAAEWVVFAGFAIYLWYRLVRDAWERELEEADENAPDARVG
ncbi:SURF1 family cytochrome oxidase biogenesis protein [Herbiconiux daphne]|uniref:SURF1-like protein n=1 Tax=Herbiconiux daphne TaxID=2970914 RepID=A0ABT2GXF1_9MICO|nr:SURF1 family cytochrome oxidase biogenesis protein [Herbiconiux daphne]MCS5732630.1 SURF1 family protein [Herbiconiux daphne]